MHQVDRVVARRFDKMWRCTNASPAAVASSNSFARGDGWHDPSAVTLKALLATY